MNRHVLMEDVLEQLVKKVVPAKCYLQLDFKKPKCDL